MPGKADGVAGVGLGSGGEDRTDAEVIDGGQRMAGSFEFARIGDRKSDDRVRPQQAPRVGRVHVGLAQMHALSANGEGDIGPVVDDQRNAGGPRHGKQPQAYLRQRPALGMRIAQLNHCCAASNGRRHDILKRMRTGQHRIGHQIERQVETRVSWRCLRHPRIGCEFFDIHGVKRIAQQRRHQART